MTEGEYRRLRSEVSGVYHYCESCQTCEYAGGYCSRCKAQEYVLIAHLHETPGRGCPGVPGPSSAMRLGVYRHRPGDSAR